MSVSLEHKIVFVMFNETFYNYIEALKVLRNIMSLTDCGKIENEKQYFPTETVLMGRVPTSQCLPPEE